MTQKTIHLFVKWQVKTGQLENLLGLLMEVVKKTMQEQGNLYFKVHQSDADQHALLLFEGYTDADALAEHRTSAHFKDLVTAKIMPLLETQEVMTTTKLMQCLPGVPARMGVAVL